MTRAESQTDGLLDSLNTEIERLVARCREERNFKYIELVVDIIGALGSIKEEGVPKIDGVEAVISARREYLGGNNPKVIDKYGRDVDAELVEFSILPFPPGLDHRSLTIDAFEGTIVVKQENDSQIRIPLNALRGISLRYKLV